jgi:hypothetical protein
MIEKWRTSTTGLCAGPGRKGVHRVVAAVPGILADRGLLMVLYDHFRLPLIRCRRWHAFHNAWVTCIISDLDQRLPEGYFSEVNVQFGIAIDVAPYSLREEWYENHYD